MTTRKQLRKRIELLQKDLRKISDTLVSIKKEGDHLYSQQQTLLDELHSACDILGESWSECCPSFKNKEKSSYCIIYQWEDQTKSARFCINCPISSQEATTRVLMCKLRPQNKEESS